MEDPVERAKAALHSASAEERRAVLHWLRQREPVHAIEGDWGASAEMILEAISRASDISRRGVLGLLAESSLKSNVLSRISGWTAVDAAPGQPFDFELRRTDESIRIQVKRQRLQRGTPLRYPRSSERFAVETQRTRSGRDRVTGAATRPYRFGDFDILAVSMQPVSGDWSDFRYAPQAWLLPAPTDASCLKVLQPVSAEIDADWTDNLIDCIARLREGKHHRIADT